MQTHNTVIPPLDFPALMSRIHLSSRSRRPEYPPTLMGWELLLFIQGQLDGVPWDSDTLDRIATKMVQAGYRIRCYRIRDCDDVD